MLVFEMVMQNMKNQILRYQFAMVSSRIFT